MSMYDGGAMEQNIIAVAIRDQNARVCAILEVDM
jgi:hypothetical protein